MKNLNTMKNHYPHQTHGYDPAKSQVLPVLEEQNQVNMSSEYKQPDSEGQFRNTIIVSIPCLFSFSLSPTNKQMFLSNGLYFLSVIKGDSKVQLIAKFRGAIPSCQCNVLIFSQCLLPDLIIFMSEWLSLIQKVARLDEIYISPTRQKYCTPMCLVLTEHLFLLANLISKHALNNIINCTKITVIDWSYLSSQSSGIKMIMIIASSHPHLPVITTQLQQSKSLIRGCEDDDWVCIYLFWVYMFGYLCVGFCSVLSGFAWCFDAMQKA